MRTERVTVTMSAEQAAQLRQAVADGASESVSSYVAAAVRDRLARDQALGRLRQAWGELPDEALAWARHTLGVTGDEQKPVDPS
jgi:Arc/MetJ-type ribon-helix-helix transcriptional regulator